MRRSIPFAAAVAATLVLAACGGGGEEETTTAAGGTTAAEETTASEATSGEATTAESGSAAAAAPNAEGTLVVWVDETRQEAVEQAATGFEEQTGIEVQTVLKNFEDIRTDFVTQVPTGEGPDITIGAHDWLGELTANGVVAPLDLTSIADQFEDIAVDAFTYDGQTYGLPYAVENIALIRNTDLAPEAPATWDEAIAAGEAAGTEYAILIQTDAEGDPYTYYPLQTSFGAPVFEQDESGAYTTALALGGENGAAFATWLAEQGETGAGVLSTSITYDIAVEAFAAGESPFVIGGPWMLASFEGLNLAVDPIPTPGANPAAPFAGVQGFYINAETPDTLIATDFLTNFMSTEEAQLALYEAGDRTPALTAAADVAAQDELTAGFRAVSETAVPMPSIPEMGAVWQFWGVTEADIISGAAADPVAAWETMVGNIQAELDSAG